MITDGGRPSVYTVDMSHPSDRDYDKHPWKEAVLLGGAMLFTAVVLLSFSITMLGRADIIQKSTREVPAKPLKPTLEIPEVETRRPAILGETVSKETD